jgi:WD40 repeat protein
MHTRRLVTSFDTRFLDDNKALAFTPDSQNLINVAFQGGVEIWSLAGRQRVWSGSLTVWDIPSAATTADTTLLAHGGSIQRDNFFQGLPSIGQPDGTIYLARLSDPAPTNQDAQCAAPRSPKATSVRSTSCPRIRPFLELRGHRGAVSALAFSRDQQWLVSGSWDKTVRVWQLQ